MSDRAEGASRPFAGFREDEGFTRLPEAFFRELLAVVDDPAELKITLYALWLVEHMQGPARALRAEDFEPARLGLEAEQAAAGLARAVRRGTLLAAGEGAGAFYLLNTPRGRAAAEAHARGEWSGPGPAAPPPPRPNVFKLYEENVGPLTPMIADALKDAEATYPREWVAEALEIAVKNNVRAWKYIEAILKRWKEKGKHEGKDRSDPGKGSERYTQSEFAEYLERD